MSIKKTPVKVSLCPYDFKKLEYISSITGKSMSEILEAYCSKGLTDDCKDILIVDKALKNYKASDVPIE